MILKVIENGSSGNFFVYEAKSGQQLIIDFGVNFSKIQRALKFNYGNVQAVLNTHIHADHFKSAKEICKAGMNIYASQETIDNAKFKSHRLHKIDADRQYEFGEFKVIPFDVKHDVRCFGFLLYHIEMGKTVHITDTYMVEHKFSGLNNIVIEANYCDKIIEDLYEKGLIPNFLHDRVIQSHLSLKNCKGILSANDLKSVYQIVLIHLSERNADSLRFKKEIEELTNKKVSIATNGLEMEFNKTPF